MLLYAFRVCVCTVCCAVSSFGVVAAATAVTTKQYILWTGESLAQQSIYSTSAACVRRSTKFHALNRVSYRYFTAKSSFSLSYFVD